jgi:hypothetical protein
MCAVWAITGRSFSASLIASLHDAVAVVLLHVCMLSHTLRACPHFLRYEEPVLLVEGPVLCMLLHIWHTWYGVQG